MSASDDPAWVSESAIVPENRPASSGFTEASSCSSVPNLASRFAFAIVSMRYPVVLTLAAENQANPASATAVGNCAPPRVWPIAMLIRSAWANASHASFTSPMTVTFSPSKLGSFASLFLLCGAKYRVASCSHRSRTPSNVSRECSANRSRFVSSSTRSHSYSRKSRSRRESRVDFIYPSSPRLRPDREIRQFDDLTAFRWWWARDNVHRDDRRSASRRRCERPNRQGRLQRRALGVGGVDATGHVVSAGMRKPVAAADSRRQRRRRRGRADRVQLVANASRRGALGQPVSGRDARQAARRVDRRLSEPPSRR